MPGAAGRDDAIGARAIIIYMVIIGIVILLLVRGGRAARRRRRRRWTLVVRRRRWLRRHRGLRRRRRRRRVRGGGGGGGDWGGGGSSGGRRVERRLLSADAVASAGMSCSEGALQNDEPTLARALSRPPSPFARAHAFLAFVVMAIALFSPAKAWGAFVPPALPRGGGVVTTGGWLAPYDIRKYNEELDMVRMETGYEIDVLLVGSLDTESMEDIANETFKAWNPGDPGKDNGILVLVAPNFPKDERKARILAGKAVTQLTPEKAREILQTVIAPCVKGDDIRGGIAAGIAAIGHKAGLPPPPDDAGAIRVASDDAGTSDAGSPLAEARGLRRPPPQRGTTTTVSGRRSST